MAKKVKKVVKKKEHSKLLREEAGNFIKAVEEVKILPQKLEFDFEIAIQGLSDELIATNQRIDRIVTAIDKSKSVRGL